MITPEGGFYYESACYAQNLFAQLRHLHVDVLASSGSGRYNRMETAFWTDFVTHVLEPAVNLRSLSFGVNTGARKWPDIRFFKLKYPCLTSLTFSNIHFDSHKKINGIGTEEFIASVCETLETLELINCTILDFSEPPVFERRWADVWDYLLERLSTLRKLRVEFDSRRPGENARYSYINRYGLLLPVMGSVDGEERDKAVIETLCDLMQNRQGCVTFKGI
jgi:hypothetical protein